MHGQGEREFLEMFFPSRFLFPLQPLSMDAGSLPLFHVALQREQNECLGLKKSGDGGRLRIGGHGETGVRP